MYWGNCQLTSHEGESKGLPQRCQLQQIFRHLRQKRVNFVQFNHFERNICSKYENITQEICKSISDFVDT